MLGIEDRSISRSEGSVRQGSRAGSQACIQEGSGIRRRALRLADSLRANSPAENLVRERGLEPPRVLPHKILSLARLPVPPLPPRGNSLIVLLTSRVFRVLERAAGIL